MGPPTEMLRSRQNPRVQAARRIARDVREARREGVLLADGITLVREALQARLAPQALFLDPADSSAEAIRAEAALRGAAVAHVSAPVLRAISTLTTPQGAVGVFARPRCEMASLLAAADAGDRPLLAVFHGLQDPTNAGSLIRTACAAGLIGAVTTEGTVDPFHPRAIRAAMGACFRLPVCVDVPGETLWESLRRGGYRILSLDPRGDAPLSATLLEGPTAIMLGREGSGLDDRARSVCDRSIRIPMAPGVESLGVAAAGAIVFYALAVLGGGSQTNSAGRGV